MNKIEQNFSEQQIREIIKSSLSMSEAARKFGYASNKPKTVMVQKIIDKYKIDTSHFRSRTKIDNFSIDEIIDKISNAKSYRQALISFGYSGQSRDNKWIDFFANLYNIDISHYNQYQYKDLTNITFGDLKCLEIDIDKTSKHYSTYWKCLCQRCGKTKTISIDNLNHGQKNCGCLKQSYEVAVMIDFLDKNNINYEQEYSFDDLRGLRNIRLRFDFALKNKENVLFLIEYQGEQHFRETNDFWGGAEGFKKRKEYDQKKRDYCKNHNIHLYEITYKDDTIEKLKEILKKEQILKEN